MTNEIAAETQTSDPYDGILPVLEARVETHRAQEAATDAIAALATDPGLVAATPMRHGYSDVTARSRDWFEPAPKPAATNTALPRHCPDCATGLLRIIRNSDDTVRHVNGEKCKRFHS